MKKAFLFLLAVMMAMVVFTGCKNTQSEPDETTDSQDQDLKYAFEFTDVNGKVHKLSDYEGKPVYLEVWGSDCSYCLSALEGMNEFAGQEHAYYVLSVVFPGRAGEKSEEDFIAWYKEFGYENLIVMFDTELQIARDFGINGFPSNIFFDAKGNFAGGQVGLMTPESIDKAMMSLVEQQ